MKPSREFDLKTFLLFVARGYSSKDIGKYYCLNTGTIEAKLSQLYKRLGVNSRTTLIVEALKKGFITLEEI